MSTLTSKNASDSYKIVYELLDDLKHISVNSARYDNVLKYLLSEKNGRALAEKILSNENAHELNEVPTKELLVILKHIATKIENEKIVFKANELLNTYEKKFNLHLEYMQIRTSGLKWNFLSSGFRYDIETLYDEVTKLLDSGLPQQIHELRLCYMEPCNISEEDIIEYYKINAKQIRKITKILLKETEGSIDEYPKLVKNKK